MADKSETPPTKPFDFSVMALLPVRPCNTPEDADPIPYEATEAYALEMQKKRRDALVEKVEKGLLTPEQAEQEALEGKIGPLASRLGDLSAFTEEMDFWTLEMTATWIDTLLAEAVHRHYYPSYAGKRVWGKTNKYYSAENDSSYWDWDKRKPADAIQCYGLHVLQDTYFGDSYVDFDGETKHFPRLETFFPKLQKHLKQGEITATGELEASLYFERRDIRPEEWESATFDLTGAVGPRLRTKRNVFYQKISFRSQGLLKFYSGNIILRPNPCRIFPWKAKIEIEPGYKSLIVARLRQCFPRGIPDRRPKKILYPELMNALGPQLATRWWTMPGAQDTVKKEEAFRTAINRILDKAVDKTPIVFDDSC
ncbi:hypothetical protein AB3G45_20795 [Shinella sp. S4-D37]|uniref:hypothetical protein n=1 Tax=Shinella sp. S4-D37 TaxID=3161999 RepID=UPI00346581D3